MIELEENRIITLESSGKYLLITDIGELEEFEGKRFFFAIGVTDDYQLDLDDLIFMETYKEGDDFFVSKVDEESEEYKILSCLQVIKEAMNCVPGFEEKLALALAETEI